MSTATDEQVAVIRRGWMGTAGSVAPEVAGLTDFMEDRLVDLESRGELTENDLLAVVEAASQMVLAAGNADQARDTSRRMRRTVYEFLLALDASSNAETENDHHGHESTAGSGFLTASHENGSPGSSADPDTDLPAAEMTDPSPLPDLLGGNGFHEGDTSLAWEGVGRRHPVPAPDAGTAEATAERAISPAIVAPRAGFHLTDPIDLSEPGPVPGASEDGPEAPAIPLPLGSSSGSPDALEVAATPDSVAAAEPGPLVAAASQVDEPAVAFTPLMPGPGAAHGSAESPVRRGSEPELESAAVEPDEANEDRSTIEFVSLPTAAASRSHFDDRSQSGDADRSGEPSISEGEVEPFENPAPAITPPVRPPALQTPAAWSAKVTEAARPMESRGQASLVPDVWGEDLNFDEAAEGADLPVADGMGSGHGAAGDQSADDMAAASWRVRKPELVGEGGRRGSSGDLPSDSWQAADDDTEPQPDLSTPRREIDDLLRRKRYDQTGAVLQQLAQEPGGRAVAELALDIGDRCRAMGKRMAATSCYLAASRADPVFEEPLGRLADVCIDDRDIDLAVSYLERIARLTRASGDVKGALRIYRKIHAIAPYRDDILDLLMRAQSTGRLDA